MANNTKRQFLNRVEIYSDSAGREGWRGTYEYTKMGSITKETSDKSGDGYKQNNSTTYAKNKVIWYRIKLNLGSGDVDKTHTLTVVDLSIPSIGLALPVMQQWSYPGLKIAPGRYSGSLYTDDLVIAGHNYARHFSPLTHLTVGTEVLFVDMNDNTWHYAVSDTEVLQPTQIEEMAVKTPDSNWDLTLFTCTTTGQARYALRCVRTDE